MPLFHTRRMALVLSAVAIAAAGCGSSSKSKSTAATPATPSTPATSGTGTTTTPAGGFSAQLNSLCKQANQVPVTTASDLPKWAAEVQKLVPQLEALTPPAALKAEYGTFLTTAKEQLAAATKKDLATVEKLQKQAQGQGAKLGAPGCDA
jgi:ABC-type glycerol-3-phosphate transport system substrate-binding protein